MILECPSCKIPLDVGNAKPGDRFRCPDCKTLVVVPGEDIVTEQLRSALQRQMSSGSQQQTAVTQEKRPPVSSVPTQPTSAMVEELRRRTGAGATDCRNALIKTQGDIEKAIGYLRGKGAKTQQTISAPQRRIPSQQSRTRLSAKQLLVNMQSVSDLELELRRSNRVSLFWLFISLLLFLLSQLWKANLL